MKLISKTLADRLAAVDARVAELLEEVPAVTSNAELLARRRQAIVEASMEEFYVNGFHSAAISDIARRAGIDKRTMYDYVGDKDDLLYVLFLYSVPWAMKEIASAVDESGSPADELIAISRAHLRFTEEHPRIALLYYRELRHLHRDKVTNVLWLFDQWIGLYEDVIGRAVEAKAIRPVQPRIAARCLASALDMPGLAAWDLQRFARDEVEDAVLDVVLRGLLADAPVGG